MKSIHLMLAIVFSFCVVNAYSQQQEQDGTTSFEIPSGPLLNSAPAFSQWIITISYPDDKKENGVANPSDPAKPIPENLAARPRTITTTKTGEIIHEETVTVGGNKLENWQINGDFYIKFPGNSFWSAYEKSGPPTSDSRVALLPACGFRGLDWINKYTYAGKIKSASGFWLVFVPGGRETVNAQDPTKLKVLDTLPTLAYVDAETRLPVMARADGVTRAFSFTQPPPTSLQTLPADLADEIKKGAELRAKRAAAPLKEY